MYELSQLKKECDVTGECQAYELRLQQEQQKIDHSTIQANQMAILWGFVAIAIGLFILLTPFIKFVKRMQKAIIPSLAIIAPIIIGLVVGLYIGFIISFSACFKQLCSAFESAALFIVPSLSLLLTVPLAVAIYKKRRRIAKAIDTVRTTGWVVIGVIILLFAVVGAYSAVVNNLKSSDVRKAESIGR
jgi:hypothetical protein